MTDRMRTTPGSSPFSAARSLIAEQWPHRHHSFGVRMMLRSLIRHAQQLRDQGYGS